ncbi:protein phosphatase CheZ [Cohaesibacter celericrescens]|uniref:protein phosphatase CheZ n=1 Tax=Cohaesibacter celericrescens TaxID=2067669 RepID=UPI00356718F3
MPPTPLRQEDYLAIEAAVMETARGRWFLSEYARRNRNADTDTLLNAIDKLEKSVVRERAPASVMNRVKLDLADMAAAIEKTKLEIAQIKHEDNDGAERFERATVELDAIVSQTENATSEILGAAEKIQEYAWTLREQGANEEDCNALDGEATNIYMACSFQDLTGQRIKKIVDAMSYVETRINSMINIWGFESQGVEIDHTQAKSQDARPDSHLLNGPSLNGEGVEQSDVDVILSQSAEQHDSSQDDVDALFDQMSDVADATDVFDNASIDIDFDSIETETETDSEASVTADEPISELTAETVEFATLDMNDLDWATETVDAVAVSSNDKMEEADVFASALVEETGQQNEEASAQAKVLTGSDVHSADADVFASAKADKSDAKAERDVMVGDMEMRLADLRDRVADFS